MVRKSEHMFEKVNITPLSMEILTFLARNPEKEFYLREIAKAIKKSTGGTHKALKSLRNIKLINVKKSGKNMYFTINQKNPSIKNYKIFITINELNTFVNSLREISEKIILFGSCAYGEDTIDSDIDLLILTKYKDKVNNTVRKGKLGRKIQAVVVDSAELIKLKEKDKAFYQEIKKGITLWEEQNE